MSELYDGGTYQKPDERLFWVTERTKPKAKKARVGGRGTIANCLPGDMVWVYNKSGSKRYKATLAWFYNDGFASVRINDSLRSEGIRAMPSTARVEFRKVRPR